MLFYALAKYGAYSLWCFVGLYLLARTANLKGALKFGAVRWLLGLAFGIGAAIGLGSIDSQDVAVLYFSVYIPLRIVEWSIMALIINKTPLRELSIITVLKALLWIAGGIAVSFATDLLSPEGMAGRFCVGRCLC